jgi:hypothetical protein
MSGRLKSLERNTKAIINILSSRYGMSPTKYGMGHESADEDPDEDGYGTVKGWQHPLKTQE